MAITPDMLSRPPGPGEIFCAFHGIGTFDDGGCKECKEAVESGAMVSCPNHGLQAANSDADGKPLPGCPTCGGAAPKPNPTFDSFPDPAPSGVIPKTTPPPQMGEKRPAAKPIKEPKSYDDREVEPQ